MSADLFISYAWTSDQHRQWVRLLAAQLKGLGFEVLIDADVDYGDSLTGFMRRVREARHVLLVADENYVVRADTLPNSGVGIESAWIEGVYEERPANWLSVLFKDNLNFRVPSWLPTKAPKGHSFNARPETSDFPGSEQLEDLWRWIEGLPANRDGSTSIGTLRVRSGRLERHRLRCDPAQWRSPSLHGDVRFLFRDAPAATFRWGLGEDEFALCVSGCGDDSIYVYNDPSSIRAVGVLRSKDRTPEAAASQLSPGRSIVVHQGQHVVLLNEHGALAFVHLDEVQRERTGATYAVPYVHFHWEVIAEDAQ